MICKDCGIEKAENFSGSTSLCTGCYIEMERDRSLAITKEKNRAEKPLSFME